MRVFALRYGGTVVSDMPCAGRSYGGETLYKPVLPCECPPHKWKRKIFRCVLNLFPVYGKLYNTCVGCAPGFEMSAHIFVFVCRGKILR